MSDNKNSLALKQVGKRALYLRFVFNVKRRCRLVKKHDRCVLQKCAGDGYALAFATGQLCAVFSDGRFVTARQLFDEFVAVRRLCRRKDFFVCCAVFSEADIFHYGIIKQHDILKYHRIIGEKDFGINGRNIHAADLYCSLVYIPEAGGKARTGALARAGRTNESSYRSLFRSEAHTVKYIMVVIGKADVFKNYIVSVRLEFIRTFRCRGIVYFVQTVCRNL